MSEEELKQHREELEVAINEALKESPEIKKAIGSIREHGYDVFLIIEATIGFSRQKDGSPSDQPVRRLPAVRLELTSHDQRFLRSLRISPE
jgi:hypothetical protein